MSIDLHVQYCQIKKTIFVINLSICYAIITFTTCAKIYKPILLLSLLDTPTYTDRSSTSWPSGSQNAERPAGAWSSQSQTNREYQSLP